jgi:histidine triad (HIT) family protein
LGGEDENYFDCLYKICTHSMSGEFQGGRDFALLSVLFLRIKKEWYHDTYPTKNDKEREYSDKCFICEKHRGMINTSGITIYEEEHVYVGHIDSNGKPNYLGHIMVDLKRHVPTLAEMNMEEAKAFGVIMARVSKALKETEKAEHIYVSGNSVPHLNQHLVARYPHTPKEYWGPWEVYDWDQAPMGGDGEVTQLCRRIKDYLENEEQGNAL